MDLGSILGTPVSLGALLGLGVLWYVVQLGPPGQ